MSTSLPPRPATPQPQIHNRLPDQPSSPSASPKKFIILITGSPDVPGRLQIAREVSSALSAPLYQGDSLHESSAKVASVGLNGEGPQRGPNEVRYQRMWLSKLTRTGLLFPEESRAAIGGFEGFGGSGWSSSSTTTSRRGSASSVSSESGGSGWSSGHESETSGKSRIKGMGNSSSGYNTGYSHVSRPVLDIPLSDQERLRRENPILMILTHPQLEKWHKVAIRKSVEEYGIAIVFVPLDKEDDGDDGGEEAVGKQPGDGKDGPQEPEDWELPILRPLDPRTMTSFGDFGISNLNLRTQSEMESREKTRRWEDTELKIRIDVNGDVESRRGEVINGVRELVSGWVGTAWMLP